MIKQAVFLCVLAMAAPVWAANKCKGPDGKVSYQEAPCQQGDAQTELNIPKPKQLTADEQRITSATASGKVTRGMTAAQVRSSWGDPTKINRTVGSYGVHEQWVYDRGNFRSQYVYLENGVVTSFQSPGE